MKMDLTGINNINEYYTNHYFSSIFEENAEDTISSWRLRSKENDAIRTPWSLLRECSRQFYYSHEKFLHTHDDQQKFNLIMEMANLYLESLGYPIPEPNSIVLSEKNTTPIYLEIKKPNGAPLLWILLASSSEQDLNILQETLFDSTLLIDNERKEASTSSIENEELVSKIFFSTSEPPRWLLLISFNQIALIDRNKWNEKRYLRFDLEEIFSRREESTFQAMAVLLHKESLCPEEGTPLLDKFDENSHRHASAVSEDLKYSLRECIELLGNEVLFDMAYRLNRNMENYPVDEVKLTIECLRYMYRMLFVLFIEARPELGYAPMNSQSYAQSYSLESVRDVAEKMRTETTEVNEGFYLHQTLSKLFNLIYNGYPEDADTLKEIKNQQSLHDIFTIDPLKAHIFDPEYTPMITNAKLCNKVMLKIIDLMSITRSSGHRNDRRGRISYSALGINQMGAVYEALLSYRGFIASETLYEVKRARDEFNELDVGYFIPENELDNYTEEERVRYESGEKAGKLRKYDKGTFIYRLAGREREKSASYYTPEVLTKCLVKYSLKELLEGKSADEILKLTVCEPAMGSAAFLNEVINQLAEAYLDKKQRELGESISHVNRLQELQRVKMYIADRNVYGIDLNPVAVELAEVSLWLNTIFKGAYVPWFGMQLVNGNSLIGARRQCYRIAQLQSNRSQSRWYENAPERILPKTKRMPKKQIYHFLMGDPGMANYTDKVIKDLEPENIQTIKNWNRKFIEPHKDEEIETLLRLSGIIDSLWNKQVELRKTVNLQTSDTLSVYGHMEDTNMSHTTIREKDLIFKRLYKSEEMENAGPYARLKFAMDYWCALWFWPIDKVDLLPTRNEFLFDMSLILEGGIVSVTKDKLGQAYLFPTELEQMADSISDLYNDLQKVDLKALCDRNPRLKLAQEIAQTNKFMHWELEFADLFEERDGFDLIIGNPPWIKIGWNEQAVLSDKYPILVVKDLSASNVTKKRTNLLMNKETKATYLKEYVVISGIQNFLNAAQNYNDLLGQQTNLYKCFLPQAWQFTSVFGVSAFIHPEGIYEDPNGGPLRKLLYPKIRKHFQFQNEKKLFSEVANRATYSLNIYCNNNTTDFESISNLFIPSTIDESYVGCNTSSVGGIKDNNNNWNFLGHPDRILHVEKPDLVLFAKLFDGGEDWQQARFPSIHSKQLLDVLVYFTLQKNTLSSKSDEIYTTEMWHETNAQNDGTIIRNVHFPESSLDLIYSGPHIGVSNPFFQSSKKDCATHRAFDSIDLMNIQDDYLQRCNYSPNLELNKYIHLIPSTPWGLKYHDEYKLIARKMLNLSGERTLVSAIVPIKSAHIFGLIGFVFKDKSLLILVSALFSSITYDFFIKVMGKSNLCDDNAGKLPITYTKFSDSLCVRSLLLNCLTNHYSELWTDQYKNKFEFESWTKLDTRLKPERFSSLISQWSWDTPLRTDYERRQALLEIDVLTALSLGMKLDQLNTIYKIQFPVLQSYESDTWYDRNGRIVFTNNRSLTNVGFTRTEWDEIKEAKSGTFTRIVIEDTMPGGPIERVIEYVAPFDRCNREEDYETAWNFFEERFKDK